MHNRTQMTTNNKPRILRGIVEFYACIKFAVGYIAHYLPVILHQTFLTTRPAIEAIGNIRRYRHTDYGLLISASVVGILIGVFVAIFHNAMEFAEVMFRRLTFVSEKFIPWEMIAFPLIPAFAGLIIGLLQKSIFKGATITGLHNVVEALVKRDGRIDWRNSFKNIIYAALSISSGGGAGREGPTIALGASLGSTFAQILRLRPDQLRVLCGSGAAAAVSGIFNAPLGGIVFALEAIIGEISVKTFVPLVISSVLATATTRLLVGTEPLLAMPALSDVTMGDYLFLAIAGLLSGFIAIYYLRVYYAVSRKTEKMLIKVPDYWRPAFGGLMAGVLVVLLPTMLETTYSPINYAIAGEGAPLLAGSIFEYIYGFFTHQWKSMLWILVAAATFLVKPVSNAVTLASGGAGGTMAPVLKAGAMFGFVFGSFLSFIFPDTSPGLYALVCAGAVFAGTFRVPLAGGIVLFEICHNYDLILPLIFSSVFASFIVQKSGIATFNPLPEKDGY